MKIRTKIGGGYLILFIVILVTGAFSIENIKKIDSFTERASQKSQHLAHVSELEILILKADGFFHEAFQGNEQAWIRFENINRRFKQTIEEIFLLFKGREEIEGRESIDIIADKHTEYVSAVREAYDFYLSYRPTDASRIVDEKAAAILKEILQLCDRQINLQKGHAMQYGLEAHKIKDRSFELNRIFLISGLIITVILGTAVTISIVRPIFKLQKGTDVISGGNFDYKVGTDAEDEIGQFSRSFDRMTESLKTINTALEHSNEKLKKKNAEMDEFTYVSSHDLQEPLRKLVSFSDLLRKDLGDSLPERAAKDMAFITDAALRMQMLIQKLLDLSRAGKNAMKIKDVSLAKCADLAIRAIAIQVEEANAGITRDNLPEVMGDPTMLAQLYQNLIGNAIKFNSNNRPSIKLTSEQIDGQSVYGVKDNGIGINPAYTRRIFYPFKRLHGRTEYEGSGIGLAICQKIVARHGGKIWVESEPGKGAHFKFTINLYMADEI